MAEQVIDQELATEAAEAKATKTRKTPEEKKAAKRERARRRRIARKAEELGVTVEEVIEQRKARKESAAARKAGKSQATEIQEASPLAEAENLVKALVAKRTADGLSEEEKKALKAAQDKARYYRNKQAA